MISVCIPTYNGEKYISQQLSSILAQLSSEDEVVISDDCSTDNTLEIIKSFKDSRIKIYQGIKYKSLIFNLENALKNASGEYIFLSDQDDIWLPDKVEIMMKWLNKYHLVISDAIVVDGNLNIIKTSFNNQKNPLKNILYNIYKNPFLGCCMAFRREILKYTLPFPSSIPMHDIWIGLIYQVYGNCKYINDKLIYFRRHNNNASCTAGRSNLRYTYRIYYRLLLLYYIFIHLVKKNVFKYD